MLCEVNKQTFKVPDRPTIFLQYFRNDMEMSLKKLHASVITGNMHVHITGKYNIFGGYVDELVLNLRGCTRFTLSWWGGGLLKRRVDQSKPNLVWWHLL